MATVNKQSLREEFDALKGEFERLCASGKMTADSRALFQAMLMLFEVLRVVFMEKRTPKKQHQLQQTVIANPQGRYRHHPPRRQQQGEQAQCYLLRQHPHD
ncbi:hypothetical protein [Thiolapillus sp.]|uniref:hypothetical protein n=2 Tax=Thiolapillus sp. TaxID=2017437 RepID=UPI003AF510AB